MFISPDVCRCCGLLKPLGPFKLATAVFHRQLILLSLPLFKESPNTIGFLARKASRWLYEALCSNIPTIRGESLDEVRVTAVMICSAMK